MCVFCARQPGESFDMLTMDIIICARMYDPQDTPETMCVYVCWVCLLWYSCVARQYGWYSITRHVPAANVLYGNGCADIIMIMLCGIKKYALIGSFKIGIIDGGMGVLSETLF